MYAKRLFKEWHNPRMAAYSRREAERAAMRRIFYVVVVALVFAGGTVLVSSGYVGWTAGIPLGVGIGLGGLWRAKRSRSPN